MMIIKLQGGLGNQLFQYAFGRALALHRDEELDFDISGFPDHNNRKYCLDKVGLQLQFASAEACYRAKYLLQPLYWRLLCRFLDKPCPPVRELDGYFREKGFAFDPSVFTAAVTYVAGYWQSERYWSGHEDIIRRELSFNVRMSSETQEAACRISACNSVSVHFRRGDYVTDAATMDYHGCCSLEYYMAAVGRIAEVEKDIELFVFSDDIEWCRRNFKPDYRVQFITHTATECDYEDIWLMSRCKHNIIANSSFSWWGAWLNPNPEGKKIAPCIWFKRDELNANISDLLPDDWIRI
jgi:hypothetical protein